MNPVARGMMLIPSQKPLRFFWHQDTIWFEQCILRNSPYKTSHNFYLQWTWSHTDIFIYTCTYIYTYIHIYIYTYIHIYRYTYIHVYIGWFLEMSVPLNHRTFPFFRPSSKPMGPEAAWGHPANGAQAMGWCSSSSGDPSFVNKEFAIENGPCNVCCFTYFIVMWMFTRGYMVETLLVCI